MTKGASLRGRHLIITKRARTINIIIIISTRRELLKRLEWRWGCKTTKVRLVASDATDSSVHLIHLIRQMVKTTIKISMHVLEQLHDASERDIYPRGGRRGRWGRGSRGRGCIRCLHMWPLPESCAALLQIDSLLINGTHDMEERKGRNGDVHLCEDACDSWRKDKLITCSSVLIAIYNILSCVMENL